MEQTPSGESIPLYNIQDSSTKQVQPHRLEWLQGFWLILRQPRNVYTLNGANVLKIIAASILLYGVCFTTATYITWVSQPLRQQITDIDTYMLSLAKEPPREQATSFDAVKVFGGAMLQNALISVLLTGSVFSIVHRIFGENSLPTMAVMGIVGYSLSITGVGFVVTALIQLLTMSIQTTPSLGIFFPLQNGVFLYTFLSRIDVFTIWQYLAISHCITSLTGISTKYSYIISAICFFLYCGLFGFMSYSGAKALGVL